MQGDTLNKSITDRSNAVLLLWFCYMLYRYLYDPLHYGQLYISVTHYASCFVI